MKALLAISLVSVVLAQSGCVSPKGGNVLDRQADAQQMKIETLNELKFKIPESEGKLDQAVGYGVFRKRGAALVFVGASNGFGVMVDKETNKETYMKAFSGSAGLGFGIKNYRSVIIIYDPAVLEKFVTKGWDFGAQADAVLESSKRGGNVGESGTFTRSMDIYEFTKNGIFLSASIDATRIWPDKNLNIE